MCSALLRRLIRAAAEGGKGGAILFRGSGAAARRCAEAGRSGAEGRHLGADGTAAGCAVLDGRGEVTAVRSPA
ncbi:hypothetical protein GCM10027440_36430 [Nocardiopsis coralliicola]